MAILAPVQSWREGQRIVVYILEVRFRRKFGSWHLLEHHTLELGVSGIRRLDLE